MKKNFGICMAFMLLVVFSQCGHVDNNEEVDYATKETIVTDSITAIITDAIGEGTVIESLPAVANRLLAMDEVSSAEVNQDDIVITFADGSKHFVLFRPAPTESQSDMKWELPNGKDGDTRNVVVWEPFRSEYESLHSSLSFIDGEYLADMENVSVDACVGNDCTIESLSRIFERDLVFIHTHGVAGGKWMATHEAATEERLSHYDELIRQGFVAAATVHIYNDDFQTVPNATVLLVSDTYLRSLGRRLDGAVVYGGYCHSLDNNAPLCQAFRDLGANVFFGFQGSVETAYNARIARLFSYLYCVSGYTALTSFDMVRNTIPDDPITVYTPMFPFGITTTPNKFRKDGDEDVSFFSTPVSPPSGNDVPPEGAAMGLFSVSPTLQVFFSQGNLQYQASTNTWRFAEHQYDQIGDNNAYASATYSGWIDLYCWGTSGWNSGATEYQPYSGSMFYDSYYTGGSPDNDLTGAYANADWAYYNAISNGGQQAELWRCLTHEEYIYLIEGREEASQKYAYARVNGINGLVILPDRWTLPDGLSFRPQSGNWEENVYDADQWSQMEAEGALFLPTTGTRQGNSVFYVDGLGDYWSSTSCGIDSGHSMSFFNANVYPGDSRYRFLGTAVRPVQELH